MFLLWAGRVARSFLILAEARAGSVSEGFGHGLLPVKDQLEQRAAKVGLQRGIGILKLGTLGRGQSMVESAVQSLLEKRQQGPTHGFLQASKSAVPKYS